MINRRVPVIFLLLAGTARAQDCLWVQSPAAGPSARAAISLAYDSDRQRVVLYGGLFNYNYFRETWEWDGAAWSLRATDGPANDYRPAMAYDSARHRTVLCAGGATGTWEWDGLQWMQVSASAPSTTSTNSVMVFDSGRARSLLIVSSSTPQTWEWDGVSWTLRATGGPSSRDFAAAAYDSARARTVLFGGLNFNTSYGDTWEFDSQAAQWTQRVEPGPPARHFHSMTYDSARSRTILYGGYTNLSNQITRHDTWEWDGAAWTMTTNANPTTVPYTAMAYDAARARVVMTGNAYYPPSSPNQTWLYNSAAANPGVIFTQQPQTYLLSPGDPAAFTVAVTGAGLLTYRWRLNGIPLSDGPRISGSASTALTINPVQRSDEGFVDVVVTDACGPAPSDRGILSVIVPCYANCDNSTTPPILNANDFECFLNLYAANFSYANCDGSTAPPILNANDFQCFLNNYATGCQ